MSITFASNEDWKKTIRQQIASVAWLKFAEWRSVSMLLTILAKSSILDIWLGSKNATKSFNKSVCEFNIFRFSSHLVIYSLLSFYEFLFFPILKNDLQVLLYKTFIFFVLQTNIYIKTYTSMLNSSCCQGKALVSNNFKWKKLIMLNVFTLKWKKIKSSFFC